MADNVVDFAHEPDLLLVCIRTRPGLAALLHAWNKDSLRPYLGQHWPT